MTCWSCRTAPATIPVAFKETPTRHVFDLCDDCWKAIGEAFVRLAPEDLCARTACRRYLPGLQTWMSAKGREVGLYCSTTCAEAGA